jgi:uncharacterized cupredoxin-like copper-binding protein
MRNQRKRLAAAAGLAVALGGGAVAHARVAAPTVTITLKEFKLTPAKTSTAAGRVTFVVVNAGKLPHALALSGPGVKAAKTPIIAPGRSARLTVTLKTGGYALWCPVANHAAMGMRATVRAGASGGYGGAPSAPTPTTTSSGGGYDYG